MNTVSQSLPPYIALPIPLPEATDEQYQRLARRIAGWAMQNARAAIREHNLSQAEYSLEEASQRLRNLVHFAEPAEFAESSHPREVEALTEALLCQSVPPPFAGHSGYPPPPADEQSLNVNASSLQADSLTPTQLLAVELIRKLLRFQQRVQQAAALPDPPA